MPESRSYQSARRQQIKLLDQAYNELIEEISRIYHNVEFKEGQQFRFEYQDPASKRRATQAFRDYRKKVIAIIETSQKIGYEEANEQFKKSQLERLEKVKSKLSKDEYLQQIEAINAIRVDYQQLEKLINRKVGRVTISDRVWDIQNLARENIENALTDALGRGKSAQSLARSIKRNLNQPDKLFRRVRNKAGKLVPSKPMKAYHPGQGVYRSAHKNAMRLARTEINHAYKQSEQISMLQTNDVVGQRIRVSHNHAVEDVCDLLQGDYPKDFVWSSWHPQCYHKETKVFTENGWKYFYDVKIGDRVWSMNPKTEELEIANVVDIQKRMFNGNLLEFYNEFFSLIVTPDHKIIYKGHKGRFSEKKAEEFKNGTFYRTSKWDVEDVQYMNIKDEDIGEFLQIKFDDFCEFMAYYLAEGSLIRDHQIVLAQQDSETNKESRQKMIEVITRMGLKPRPISKGINLYSKCLNAYLKQFETSLDKFIPDEIKNASLRQIDIFLDAYSITDGFRPPPKPFIGNRGTKLIPKRNARVFSTSSKRMMNDLCELIMKMERRPHFRIHSKKGSSYEFPNGVYKTNADNYVIREAFSKTCTVFNIREIPYNDYVYDLSLDRNHTLYVSMNGKAVWGSNCMCQREFIMKSEAEFINDIKNKRNTPANQSVNFVKDVPPQFKAWIRDNRERINGWKTKPSFMRDNGY